MEHFTPHQPCPRCGHDFDDHIFRAEYEVTLTLSDSITDIRIPGGGTVTCPECDCSSTWAVNENG